MRDDTVSSNKHRPWIAAGIAGTTVLGVVALTAPFVVLPTAKKGLPYMATPANKLQKALQFLQQRQQQHSKSTPHHHRVFVDLGSGDGEGVYQAVQLKQDHHYTHPYYQSCIGIELNATLYLLSNLRRRFFWSPDERYRSEFQCRDFWNTSLLLSTADTILIFGIAPLMRPLSAKLRRDCCRPGTHILSYRFPLPVAAASADDNDGMSGEKKRNNDKDNELLVRADLIYDEEEMRIYECKGDGNEPE